MKGAVAVKKVYIIICLFITLFISGCNKKIDINLNDYRPLEDYTFEKHNFLMRKGTEEIDMLGGIYSLKGLSPNAYVGHVQYSPIPGRPSKTLYARLDVDEPIMLLNPHKILLTFDDETFLLEDAGLVEKLVDVRRKKGVQTSLYPDVDANRRIGMSFLFDIPSDLEWECDMIAGDENIKMLWYDNESKEMYICDITDILTQHSVIEDVYSLIK